MNNGANAGRRALRVAVLAGGDQILFADCVITDVIASDLVFAALYPGAMEQLGNFAVGVVFDAFSFAIDIFFDEPFS